MGHERTGLLPRTKAFRQIVSMIAAGAGRDFLTDNIALQTIASTQQHFNAVEADGAMEAAFTFLVSLAHSAKNANEPDALFALLPENTTAATPLRVALALREATASSTTSAEYRALADSAASDAIAVWFDQNKAQQSLFPDEKHDHFDVWHKAANGAGFCELSRLYFAHYVERYLNYFLEREASAALPNVAERDRFKRAMEANIEDVSQHAFETAKITQSFAAGWFNKNAVNSPPTRQSVRGFLSHTFDKLQTELKRKDD